MIVDPDDPRLLELFAEIAHGAWSGWTIWMMEKWDATHSNGETFQQRWSRQCATDYADLPESEKESDRDEARKYIRELRQLFHG